MAWHKARKKPVVIKYREVNVNAIEGTMGVEIINTLEGTLTAVAGRDYIICGVEGEIYPINKEIFNKTYDIVDD